MTNANPHDQSQVQTLSEAINNNAFAEWYRERQIKQNMRDGQPWRHTPASISPPDRHSPHKFLQCHRKSYYKNQNTPEEIPSPTGVFWAGTRIEEDIVMPFLEDTAADTEPQAYVQNSIWVDYDLDTPAGSLRVKGSTDPVICSQHGDPILPTEIKTKESLDATNGDNLVPAEHHRAQLHAYLYGLNESVSYSLDSGLIIYVDRDQHDFVAKRVQFQPKFWKETVVEWATRQTEYRLNETLPPADPEFGWECAYCPFKKRCGEADETVADSPARGFVPLTEYPREHVEKALNAEGGAETLTPTLAHQYSSLTDTYEIADWRCLACGRTVEWGLTDWSGKTADPPACPHCAGKNRFAPLRGDSPAEGNHV